MCRIWVQGVPAAKQPAPTDCPTAMRNSPPNGRVIFGPSKDSSRSGGVSQLLRSKSLPLPAALAGARGGAPPVAPPRAGGGSARRDSAVRRDSSGRRDSTVRRDSTG